MPPPEPLAGLTVTHVAGLVAFHAQPMPVVTATLKVPPPEATDVLLVGEIVKLPVPAACVTLNAWPAIVSELLRPIQLVALELTL